MTHIEIHVLASAKDAQSISQAGLPRLDLEPQQCSACSNHCGEVVGQDGAIFWRTFGLVLNGERIELLCKKCLEPLDKALNGL